MTSTEFSERWVEAARAGSLEDFEQLARYFEPRLYNFLRHRTRCDGDAEDLTQEALLRAWRNLHRYDSRYRFSTWLFTLASRLAISHGRRPEPPAALSPRGLEAENLQHPLHTPSRADDQRIEDADEARRIWALAERSVGDEARAALWLRYAEDLEPKEIAGILDKEPGTVRVLLHRARERIRAALAAQTDRTVEYEHEPRT